MQIMEIMFKDTQLGHKASDINTGSLIVNVPKLFPVFCVAIERGEENVKPNVKYLEDLPATDYFVIQNQISKAVGQMLEGKKKKV